MAEFCLNCWNKMNGRSDSSNKYFLSKDLELCEGCGKWTHVIIMERTYCDQYTAKLISLPFKLVWAIFL